MLSGFQLGNIHLEYLKPQLVSHSPSELSALDLFHYKKGYSQSKYVGWLGEHRSVRILDGVAFQRDVFLLNRHAFNLSLANTISSSLLFL